MKIANNNKQCKLPSLVTSMLLLLAFHISGQGVAENVFRVKKRSEQPTQLTWVGLDNCIVNKLYYICPDKVQYDSISIYKMIFKKTRDLNNKPCYVISKAEEGKGYIVIWNKDKASGQLVQTYVKPVFFTRNDSTVSK